MSIYVVSCHFWYDVYRGFTTRKHYAYKNINDAIDYLARMTYLDDRKEKIKCLLEDGHLDIHDEDTVWSIDQITLK